MLFVGGGRCPEATHGQWPCRPEPGSRTPDVSTPGLERAPNSRFRRQGILVGSAMAGHHPPRGVRSRLRAVPEAGSPGPRLAVSVPGEAAFLLPVPSHGRERRSGILFSPYRGTGAITRAHAQDSMSPNPSQRPRVQAPPHRGSGRACEC